MDTILFLKKKKVDFLFVTSDLCLECLRSSSCFDIEVMGNGKDRRVWTVEGLYSADYFYNLLARDVCSH